MIDTQAIRSKILDLAMRGKLTEQLPEDGTAEELYQQIQEEKQTLIQSGKIKKEKPLPEIDESDIPYDIPNSWKWTRIGTTFYVEMGQSPDGSSVSKNGKGIEFHQGKIFFGDKYINDSKQRTSNPTKIAEANSVLLCVRAPVGKVNITQRRICIGRGLSAITPISTVELDYLYYYMVTCEKAFADQGTGSTFSAINGEIIRNHLCPLPPLAEQKRIVEKIEQTFSVLDTIDELQAKYADNLTALKSKLIDLAIRGKLTEQLPEDGTAEELYQQIQEEKQALIKSDKIKKEKPLPEIAETEIPFEIPENWKWTRLSDITTNLTLNDGDWVLSDDMNENGTVKLIQLGSIGDLQYRDKGFKHLTQQRFEDMNGKQIYPGYLLINRLVADKMLLCIIPEIEGILITAVDVCWVAPQNDYYDIKYLMYALASSSVQQKVKEVGYGVTRFRISKTNLVSIPFPLPPLAEQKRIVDRLDKLLAVCDEMR